MRRGRKTSKAAGPRMPLYACHHLLGFLEGEARKWALRRATQEYPLFVPVTPRLTSEPPPRPPITRRLGATVGAPTVGRRPAARLSTLRGRGFLPEDTANHQ